MTADGKVNILLVDDQPGKLLSYETILASLGENLIKAASAREALEQLLKQDIAVVLVEHDLTMVGAVVDRTIVMDLGSRVAEGTFDEVMADPRVRDAYLGISE